MSRTRHNLELPTIAAAIQEYKTSHSTQKECAAKYGVPIKVFSYYYLNGFKKNQKVGGTLLPNDDMQPHVRKSKLRENNYNVVLTGGYEQTQQQITNPNLSRPQIPPKPISHELHPIPQVSVSSKHPSEKHIVSQPNIQQNIKDKINAATTIRSGSKHIDLDQFL